MNTEQLTVWRNRLFIHGQLPRALQDLVSRQCSSSCDSPRFHSFFEEYQALDVVDKAVVAGVIKDHLDLRKELDYQANPPAALRNVDAMPEVSATDTV
jgi:hypothetical protein